MGYGRVAVALVAAASLFAVSTSARAALPIPSVPGSLLVPDFIGAPSSAAPIPSFTVPQNPHLAPNGANNMHDDAYATNSYLGPGPSGHGTKVTSALYGVEECATEAFDRQAQIVALCGLISGPILRLLNPTTMDVRASYTLPGRDLTSGANPLTDLCGGAYFYLDDQDRAVVATTNAQIRVVADTGSSFSLVRTYDVSASVPSGDCLIALMPSWDGTIWFVTHGGTVGMVNPVSGAVHTLALPGEIVANSFAVDETGGVYVVSDHAMYRFDAAPDATPAVTWRAPYDRGSAQKPGQLSQGSGTTPALVGSDLVAITDNADPQMHVVLYNRATGAFVCQQAVFAPGASDTENSLVAVGNSLIAENNYGYQGPQSTLLGKTTSPGIAKVDVNDGQCSLAWTNNSSAPTSVAKASLQSGLLYAYTKPANALSIDAWYLTAIDIRTGRTAFSKLAGTGPQFNNHYAAIYLGPDGSAYIATLTGMLRFRDSA
ncbi:MAG: hypothetical protein QOG80_1581 [Pseudonocardiales bacterium]|nr:hypothetical protein [Pseudonocardiales bacterium]